MKITKIEIYETAKIVTDRYNIGIKETIIIGYENEDILILEDSLGYERYLYENEGSKLIGCINSSNFDYKDEITIEEVEEQIIKLLKKL